MIICQQCSGQNQDDYKFCQFCGARLEKDVAGGSDNAPAQRVCAKCGATLEDKHRFCSKCGEKYEEMAAADASPHARSVERVNFLSVSAQAVRKAASFRLHHINSDGSVGDEIALLDGENEIGKESSSLLSEDQFVSPRHVRIMCRRDEATLEDMASLNGVFRRLSSASTEIRDGDAFRIGEELLAIKLGGSKQPIISKKEEDPAQILGGDEPDGWGYLRVILGAFNEGHVFRLSGRDLTLGRTRADLLFPADNFVSGTHASLSYADGVVTLRDLDSSNGTFVRIGKPVVIQKDTLFFLIGNQLLRLAHTSVI